MARILITTGDGFASLAQQGDSWQVTRALSASRAVCLTVDPRQSGSVYVGTQGDGIWKSLDFGANWSRLDFPQPDIFSIAISPADGALYAGTEPSMLFVSRDRGKSWQELESLRQIPSAPTWSFPPRPWTSHVRWIAPHPQQAGLILVGIELGGLMRTEDGGTTWLDHRPGAQRDVHALAWHLHDPEVAYEAGGGGAAWSHDAGLTWQAADVGRQHSYCWALAPDPVDPSCWFISANPGPGLAHGTRPAEARLYRWRGSGPWQVLGGGLPDPLPSMPYALAFGGDILYAGLRSGFLYASHDRGDTWSPLDLRGDQPDSITALICLPD